MNTHESGRIVVSFRLCVTECLQYRIGLNDLVLKVSNLKGNTVAIHIDV